MKRIMKRTGRRISDSHFAASTTAGALFNNLQKRRDTEKLAKLITKEQRLSFPNVTLKERKVSPYHEDAELGRWKIIREELEKRYLPEFGTIGGHRMDKYEKRGWDGRALPYNPENEPKKSWERLLQTSESNVSLPVYEAIKHSDIEGVDVEGAANQDLIESNAANKTARIE